MTLEPLGGSLAPATLIAMHRRRLLQLLAIGGLSPALLRAKLLLADGSMELDPLQNFFSVNERLLLTALAETIIPATDTPGAREAGVADFIEVMVGQTFSDPDQSAFKSSLSAIDVLTRQYYGSDYASLAKSSQVSLLSDLANGRTKCARLDAIALRDFFHLLKELTVIAYYTSEIGASMELAYLHLPGRHDACTDMPGGQVAWSFGSRSDGLF